MPVMPALGRLGKRTARLRTAYIETLSPRKEKKKKESSFSPLNMILERVF
jgi:hypothetical protein